MSLIKLNNICVEYGRKNKQRALNDVGMEIDDKEFVAVMGKSGCGKTTLLNVLGTCLSRRVENTYLTESRCLPKTAMNLQNSETKIWAL